MADYGDFITPFAAFLRALKTDEDSRPIPPSFASLLAHQPPTDYRAGRIWSQRRSRGAVGPGRTAVDGHAYNFPPQVRGGHLTAAVPNIITPTAGVPGISGTDQNHWLLISSCSGGDQTVLIAGGTAAHGANGTLVFTPLKACAPGWTVQSASGGLDEALRSAPAAAAVEFSPQVAPVVIHATVTPPRGSSILCQGGNPMSSNPGPACAIVFSPPGAPRARSCSLSTTTSPFEASGWIDSCGISTQTSRPRRQRGMWRCTR
jgi:hypothetical protein